MLNIKLKNLFWVSIALFCATQFCSAQSSDNLPTAQVPPPHPGVAVPNSESDLTMAGESKSTKAVVEQEKPVCLNIYFEGGYTSEYMFRGKPTSKPRRARWIGRRTRRRSSRQKAMRQRRRRRTPTAAAF